MKYDYKADDDETDLVIDGEVKGTLNGWPTSWSFGVVPSPQSDRFDEFETILNQMSSPDERILLLHLISNNVEKDGPPVDDD